jgi:hypothetical protein
MLRPRRRLATAFAPDRYVGRDLATVAEPRARRAADLREGLRAILSRATADAIRRAIFDWAISVGRTRSGTNP